MTTEQPKRRSLLRLIPFKRIVAVFSITCTVLYVACWLGEVIHAAREKMEGPQPHEEAPRKPLPDRVKQNVRRQIDEIQRVDARGLGFTFLYDLLMWDCNWRFHCVPDRAANAYAAYDAALMPKVPTKWPSPLEVPDTNIAKRLLDQGRYHELPHPRPAPAVDPNVVPPPNRTPSPLDTDMTPLVTPGTGSTGPKIAVPSAVPATPVPIPRQPQPRPAGSPDPADVIRLLPQVQGPPTAKQPAEVRNAAYDEPPSAEEFGYAMHSGNSPKLLAGGPIPSLHTLLGIPRATFVTIRAILKAGPWAITVFVACAILYFGGVAPMIVLLGSQQGKSDWQHVPTVMFVLLLLSPLTVPYLVTSVQWAAAELGNAVSWMVGLLAIAATWSAAIGVLVGIPHVWKSPREVKEAYHVVLHGVEAMEKKKL